MPKKFFALVYPATTGRPEPEPLGNEPSFDDPRKAWAWLKQARIAAEDRAPDWNVGTYSSTVGYLDYASGEEQFGDGICEFGSPHDDWPLDADGTGWIYGGTPGIGDSENDDEVDDPGIAYAVVARG